VERPAQAKKRYGGQRIDKIEQEGVLKYFFEDNLVKIFWLATARGVSFVLENRTDHSIKIVWDEASYVDVEGVSHRVIHEGVKYADRNASQPPTVVVRKGSVTDIVVPSDSIYWREGFYGRYFSSPGGWETKPLFPSAQVGGAIADLKAKAEGYMENLSGALALKNRGCCERPYFHL